MAEEPQNGAEVMRILQPTYDPEPTLDGRFSRSKVEEVCVPVVREFLQDKSWSLERETNLELSQNITNLVMEKIRDMGLKRYKIIIQTNLGENRDQTVRVASQCLWESNLDGSAEVKFSSVSCTGYAFQKK